MSVDLSCASFSRLVFRRRIDAISTALLSRTVTEMIGSIVVASCAVWDMSSTLARSHLIHVSTRQTLTMDREYESEGEDYDEEGEEEDEDDEEGDEGAEEAAPGMRLLRH